MEPALTSADQQQRAPLWELCLGRGTPLLSGRVLGGEWVQEWQGEQEGERLKAICFPRDRLDRQTGYRIQRIPFPLSLWANTVTKGIGDSGDGFLPGVAGVSPL